MTNKTLNKIILSATTAMFLTACGGGGGSSENKAPTADAGADASVAVNTAITLTGSGTDTDGTIVSYSWTDASGTVLATTASFDYTPTSAGTTETFTLTVTDDDGATASDTVEITANDVPNQAPTTNAGADASVVVNTAITLTGSGTDTDGTIASYSWTDASGTVLATTASFDYTPTSTGTKILTLTVTDDDGATATDTVEITVNDVPNQAPTANAGADVSVVVNTAITLTGSGVDNDGDIVAYSWTDESGVEVSTTEEYTYTPTEDGTDTFTLTVTDNDGATATDTVVVTVEPRFSSDDTTVTDGVTGLVWDKTVSDKDTCESAASKKVPTIEQLQTIVDYSKYAFAISDEFNLTGEDTTSFYQTSDNWIVRLGFGEVYYSTEDYNKTICVNDNEENLEVVTYKKGAETDSNVTASNNLVWSDYNSTKTTFLEAETECRNKGMDLPSIVKLESLYARTTTTKIISDEFKFVERDAYWTSTVVAADENQTWVISYGAINGKDKTDTAYVRCVK